MPSLEAHFSERWALLPVSGRPRSWSGSLRWTGARGTPFRRMWACQRKHLPPRDVAAAGGWKDVTVLQGVYEAADAETLEAVVSGGKRVVGILR